MILRCIVAGCGCRAMQAGIFCVVHCASVPTPVARRALAIIHRAGELPAAAWLGIQQSKFSLKAPRN